MLEPRNKVEAKTVGSAIQYFFTITIMFSLVLHCSREKDYQAAWYVMGSRLSVEARGVDLKLDTVIAEVERLDAIFSNYRTDSEVARFNQAPRLQDIPLSEDFFFVLSAAQSIAHKTGGAFDVTVEPLVKLYDFYKPWKGENHSPPSSIEIQNARLNVGYKHLSLNWGERSAQKRKSIRLDFGAIAKGYALDKALAQLRTQKLSAAALDFGGQILVFQKEKLIQIENPRAEGNSSEYCATLSNGSISTSGDSQRYYTVNGQRYGHIIDPRTGIPAREIVQATLIQNTAMEADAWSTALVVMTAKELKKLTTANLHWIEVDVEGKLHQHASGTIRRCND